MVVEPEQALNKKKEKKKKKKKKKEEKKKNNNKKKKKNRMSYLIEHHTRVYDSFTMCNIPYTHMISMNRQAHNYPYHVCTKGNQNLWLPHITETIPTYIPYVMSPER